MRRSHLGDSPHESRWAQGRRLRLAALALALGTAGALVALYVLATDAPPPPPPPSLSPQQARQAIKHLEQQIAQVRHRPSSVTPAPCHIQVRSDEVNAYVATFTPVTRGLPQGIESVRDVRVAFEKGRAKVTGFVTAWGKPMYVTVMGTAVPDGAGGARFEAGRLRIGKVPMPRRLRAAVVAHIQREVSRAVRRMGLSVRAVRIDEGVVTLEGVPKR